MKFTYQSVKDGGRKKRTREKLEDQIELMCSFFWMVSCFELKFLLSIVHNNYNPSNLNPTPIENKQSKVTIIVVLGF